MTIGHIDVVAGTAFELLVALTDETWLNLLGIPLDAGPPYTAERLVEQVRDLDPVELRRHLLGRYAWSWRLLVGDDAIDAAAAGEASAFPTLLDHPRYYGGRARESLSELLPLGPSETQRRLAQALEARLAEAPLAAADPEAAVELVRSLPPAEAIERVTRGYRYAAEPEAARVLLIPHRQPSPSLVLAQHRDARLIVYRAPADAAAEERLTLVARALADPKRVAILALLAQGVDRASALVEATGLNRSTVHHHLSQLREARLVDLEGNARGYRYVARKAAAAELGALVAEVVGT
jgi:DNA-binding transcriptional ArsR family regulator